MSDEKIKSILYEGAIEDMMEEDLERLYKEKLEKFIKPSRDEHKENGGVKTSKNL